MNIPIVYIDQSIIGLIQQGALNLKKDNEYLWAYSQEHFREIKRSNNPDQYLKIIQDIDAKLLTLRLDENLRITDESDLISSGNPFQHYENYIQTTADNSIDETIFDPLQVWWNGGGSEELLQKFPDNFVKQIFSLISELPFDTAEITDQVNLIKLESMVNDMSLRGNDIQETRTSLGNEKGAIGNISGTRQIEKIWEIVSPTMKQLEITRDQFFGFDPIEKQNYETWPIFLGIIACCSVMDILGFQAEKKIRKINKLPNIRSDSTHIAMGAFSSAILSADARLINRAKAIYQYKNIRTSPILVEP